ncbi:protein DA1 [Actinocrinis sp.]|uniref:protein DA1 n=1 Tax=Actinocrinis sp. TaxID=1920516 RepID=UPI002DDD4C5F|nr:protein DA1 [Actinocrinis sp.]
MASLFSAPARCFFCGRGLFGRYCVSALGVPFCEAHQDIAACRFCGAPADAAEPTAELCAFCVRDAVLTRTDSAREIPGIRDEMHRLDLRLNVPVRVRLADRAQMAQRGGHQNTAGLTEYVADHVVSITIVKGLVRRQFGATVVHECMHAWLVQNAFPPLSDRICEGLCQAMAYRYLREHRGEPRAKLLMERLRDDPDPIYGDGFRMIRDSAVKNGFSTVVDTVRRTGRVA